MNYRVFQAGMLAAALIGGFAAGWFGRGSASKRTDAQRTGWTRQPARSGPAQSGSPTEKGSRLPSPAGGRPAGKDAEGAANTVGAGESGRRVPRSPGDVMERLLSELENPSPGQTDSLRFLGRLQQLKDYGEEGSAAIRDFLHSRQDLSLAGGFGMTNGRITQFPSLRASLLEVLYDQNDPTAKAACLDVLRDTTSGLEALLAARNLEKYSPGANRAEILSAVSEILPGMTDSAPDPSNSSRWMDLQVLEVVGHFQARELLPQAEELVKKQPNMIYQWIGVLTQFPGDEQRASINRLMADDNLKKAMLANGYMLAQLNFQDDGIRQMVSNAFSRDMGDGARQQFIQALGRAAYVRTGNRMMKPEATPNPRTFKPDKTQAENALRELDNLTPFLDSPPLKQAAEQARHQLQEQLKTSR